MWVSEWITRSVGGSCTGSRQPGGSKFWRST